MTSLPQLRRLDPVDLRSLWPDEARSFTPWLAEPENLRLLGEALGMDLELVRTESEVGSSYTDVVCRDTADGSHVLIENQLERTDHTHLGQILTYAAGLDAVTIVRIAKLLHKACQSARGKLNNMTTGWSAATSTNHRNSQRRSSPVDTRIIARTRAFKPTSIDPGDGASSQSNLSSPTFLRSPWTGSGSSPNGAPPQRHLFQRRSYNAKRSL